MRSFPSSEIALAGIFKGPFKILKNISCIVFPLKGVILKIKQLKNIKKNNIYIF